MRVKTINLIANEISTIPAGVLFTIIDCDAPVNITFHSGNETIDADAENVGAGYLMEDQQFSEARVVSAVNQVFKYGIAKNGKGRYTNPTINVTGNVNISNTITQSALSVTASGVALSANPARVRAFISARSSNPVDITIGTVAGAGYTLEAGMAIAIDSRGALNFVTASGTAFLDILEET